MHFIQFHRVVRYGEPVIKDDGYFEVFTNNSQRAWDATRKEGIVWLIRTVGVGDGDYSIVWRFRIQGFSKPDNTFAHSVIGKEGQVFDPPLPLTPNALAHLERCTQNFQFGFTEIDAPAIEELEAIVARGATNASSPMRTTTGELPPP